MYITEAKLVVDLDGFVAALKFFEELNSPNICFEHEKRASDMQTMGPSTHYEYELTITASRFPTVNLYPVLRDLERKIDHLG